MGATPIHPFLSTCANSEVRLVWLVDLSVLGVWCLLGLGLVQCLRPLSVSVFVGMFILFFFFMVFPIPMIFSYVLLNVFFPK